MAKAHRDDGSQRLLRSLVRELFQTETSAVRHGRREARRHPGSGPSDALLAVSAHAEAVLAELPVLAEREGMAESHGGRFVGRLFSELRERALDLVIDAERSYRGTLLGMRHGVDLVVMLEATARRCFRQELTAFCERWLAERNRLVQDVAHEMRWFAEHPDAAKRSARARITLLGARRARLAMR